MNSKHWKADRKRRNEAIRMIGEGIEITRVVIDRGHENGAEIHTISTTGIITIYNQRTKKMITKLIARPGQLKRFWKEEEIPADLKQVCREHQKAHYNSY